MKGAVTVHGGLSFDVPFISEIDRNLWQGGCEGSLVLPEFIRHLVSLSPWERFTVKHDLDSILIVRLYDSEDQTFEQVEELARWVNICRATGPGARALQGSRLNRSSLVAARAHVLGGKTAGDAIRAVRKERSPACLCNRVFEGCLRGLDADGPA